MPAALILAALTRSNSPVPIVFWCAVGFIAGTVIFVLGFRLLQRRRLILDTPFSKIRSASMGMVEVSGLAAGPYTMIAPITGRPCYYYRTLVWELKQRGKNKEWVKVVAECSHLPFFVDDNTGRVLVDPRGAELDLHQDYKEEFCNSFFTTKDPAPPNVNSLLSRHGIVTSNKIKVEEFCIKPKNSLFILGTLGENPGIELAPEPVHEDEPVDVNSAQLFSQPISALLNSSRAELESDSYGGGSVASPRVIPLSTAQHPVKTLDMSQQQKIAAALVKAGITNPAAWGAAGLTAPGMQVAIDASHGTDGFEQHPAVVLKKGSNNGAFLISWRSQREVAGRLGWKCALMIPGGPALALLSLYLLMRFFHML